MQADEVLTGFPAPLALKHAVVAREQPAMTLEELFERRYASLCRDAAAILGGDHGAAEQVVQDVLEVASRRWDRIQDPERYVLRAVINRARSLYRRRKIEARANALLFSRSSLTVESGVEQWVDGQPVLAAVHRLPPRQRAVVVLYYLEDLSVEDVAATLGCSTGAVKNRLSAARHTLEQLLVQEADNA